MNRAIGDALVSGPQVGQMVEERRGRDGCWTATCGTRRVMVVVMDDGTGDGRAC